VVLTLVVCIIDSIHLAGLITLYSILYPEMHDGPSSSSTDAADGIIISLVSLNFRGVSWI
jgi:hypothetical protein